MNDKSVATTVDAENYFTFEVRDRKFFQVDGMRSESLVNLRLVVKNVAQFITGDFVFISCDVNCYVYFECFIGFAKKKMKSDELKSGECVSRLKHKSQAKTQVFKTRH